jgi:2,4-diketo-3-deoxy-L-fuconate hydrolase
VVAPAGLHFHPPIDLPRQIFCSGANYKKHVIQLHVAQTFHKNEGLSPEERLAAGTKMMDERAAHGTPFFFCKAQSTVAGPFDPIVLPLDVTQPDWELELGVVIGKPARRVRREDALDYVAGYVVVNDITSRERVNRQDMKEMGMDWVASKCSPGFLPMGPWLVPAAFVGDPQQLQITLRLNDTVMQDESTADMIFDVARLIETLSTFCLLQPGDLICTGSPAGNGMHYGRFLRPGDVVEGSITGLGSIRNVCVAEDP